MRKVATKPSNTNKQTTNKRRKFILLVILLVSLSIFAYYYFRFINKTNDHNNINPTTNQPISTEPITNQTTNNQPNITKENIFKIPELGIQFVLPEGLEGLEYKIVEGEGKLDVIRYATFSTKDLTDLDRRKNGGNASNCALGSGAIGGIILYKNSHYDEVGYANTWIVGSAHMGYMGPQSGCSGSEEVVDLQLKQVSLLRKASLTITEIK